jgi:hypothetical protein
MRLLRFGAFVVLLATSVTGALASTAAPVAPRATLVFRDMGSDVVGRLNDPKPNGERDAHFTATLSGAGGRVVTVIALQRVFRPKGYAEGWSTSPGTPTLVGVITGGKRINPGTKQWLSIRATAPRTFQLYASEIGTFAPGQRFRVTFFFKDGTNASAEAVLPGRQATLSASFAGLGADVVGRSIDQKPNGEADAHFVAQLTLNGGWRVLSNVSVRHLTKQGALDVPMYWMQGPNTAGLFVDGKRVLWPSAIREQIYVYVPLAPRPAPVRLELTANDPTPAGQPSLFRPGERWRLAVTFTDTVTGVTKPLELDLTT